MPDITVVQEVMVSLLLDDDARAAWLADPAQFGADRLDWPEAAAMVGNLDRRGVIAAALSSRDKHEQWQHYHDLGHRNLDWLRRRTGASDAASHDHDHPHSHDHDHSHEHGHDHPHSHDHSASVD